MEKSGIQFFSGIYQQLCEAFEQKLYELEKNLEFGKKVDDLESFYSCRKKADQTVETFKVTELQRKRNEYVRDKLCKDNIRHSMETINIDGIMVEKPYVYEKTYDESRADIRKRMSDLTGLVRLFIIPDLHSYLTLALEDFYWGKHQYVEGNKKKSYECLLNAIYHIDKYISQNNSNKSQEYLRLKMEVEEAYRKMYSSLGGRNKLGDLEYLKVNVVVLLAQDIPNGGWRTKKASFDYMMPYLCDIDRKQNPEKWQNDTGERGESILGRLDKWSKNELKDEFKEVIRVKG